jgi:hypothetical protein
VTNFTARDVAEKIRRPGETLTTAVDRLRDWVKEGLIRPAGEPHPGTGRKRQYSRAEMIDAILLETLVEAAGLKAVAAAPLLKHFRKQLPKSPTAEPFLIVSRSVGSKRWNFGGGKMSALSDHISHSEHQIHVVLDIRKILDRIEPDSPVA